MSRLLSDSTQKGTHMKYPTGSLHREFLFNSKSNIWNHAFIYTCRQSFDLPGLELACRRLIDSFDSLRLTVSGSELIVTPADSQIEHKFPHQRFSSHQEVVQKAQEIVDEPFNMQEQLFRCFLFETPDTCGCICAAHHLISDGFSAQIIADFLSRCLENNAYKPEYIENFQAYTENEQSYHGTRRHAVDEAFWQERFSDLTDTSVFENSSHMADFSSDAADIRVPDTLFDNIKSFCSSHNISAQAFFNTVYAAYISRTRGMDRFSFGVPVLNRTTKAQLHTVGLYMHVVPLLIHMENRSFWENVRLIDDAQLTLFRHQKFTQHDIKTMLAASGTPLRTLFGIVTDFQEFQPHAAYDLEFVYSHALSVPLEIHLQTFGPGRHFLKIRYRTACFTRTEILSMLRCILALAADALKAPDKRISDLELLPSTDRQKLLHDFNDTSYAYPVSDNATLFGLFEATAKRCADKCCITAADQTVTFGELLRYAETLDTAVRRLTVSKKSVIAVIAERSVEMYAAIYGIIRGGNAYLPIDPDYPQERIDYILKNSKAAAVLVQGKFAHLVKQTRCVDVSALLTAQPAGNVPAPAANAKDTAYVIYTSGSTGSPKGAAISHRSAVNRILWMEHRYPLSTSGVILQKTPYTFDVSVWELFWWGVSGGRLAASAPGEHFLPACILRDICAHKVTHLHFVPSVFDLLLTYLETHSSNLRLFSSVRHVFLSGESLSASLVRRFYKLFPTTQAKLHNLYGPTECTVDVSWYDCTPDDTDPVPIGRPIHNTQLYVVDRCMHLQPIGVQGELCIAGTNVGQGYLHNARLTAEKFLKNPFGEGRIYKTGDLAYMDESGLIYFCGRLDNQIKLNGQRIEIGEIESVISRVSHVVSAAVSVNRSGPADILTAFYCSAYDCEDAIRAACAEKLPLPMRPSVIVRLDALPLSNSGKLDRKALAAHALPPVSSVPYAAPLDQTEKYLCAAFEKILDTGPVGRNSDFFENGGTSLSVISLLSEPGFPDISAADLLRNPTPAKLAAFLQNRSEPQYRYLEPLFVPDRAENTLVLLPFAGGNAEAFAKLTESVRRSSPETAIYFTRYLHTDAECMQAADEIAEISRSTRLCLFSQCVGSALALQILQQLEKNDIYAARYFAGAGLPPSRPTGWNIWRIVPDAILLRILLHAGAALHTLPKEQIKSFLASFRNDTDYAGRGFSTLTNRIVTPVSVILSPQDPFTKRHRHAKQIWHKYLQAEPNVIRVASASHYFQADCSDQLSEIILSAFQ